jgi:predicted nucleic acid-binding protein
MERRPVCPDSSILVDALTNFDESLAAELHSWIFSSVAMIAPDLIHYEFTHVLAKHVRNRRVSLDQASDVMEALFSLPIELIDDDDLHRIALSHALMNPGLSGYDAQFVAVSERFGAELWTADKGLAAVSQRLGVATRLWVTAPA